MEMEEIVVTLFVGVKGFADRVEVSKVSDFSKAWLHHVVNNHKAAVIDAIVKENYTITKDIEATMMRLAEEFTTSYVA
jgi:F-type H+/Na+-transporting ATPase subunit alpha